MLTLLLSLKPNLEVLSATPTYILAFWLCRQHTGLGMLAHRLTCPLPGAVSHPRLEAHASALRCLIAQPRMRQTCDCPHLVIF